VDALGWPVAYWITAGQRHDITAAPQLVELLEPTCLLADTSYDSDEFRAGLKERGCTAVIPSSASRSQAIPYDKDLYKARSEVERTFNRLKQCRRFATRYEKTLRNYAAVVALGCIRLWLGI